MVGASTKRRRRDKANAAASAVEDGMVARAAEVRALGTEVAATVPDAALFQEDRRGTSKGEMSEVLRAQLAEQVRAAKRAKRSAPRARKSEMALVGNRSVKAVYGSNSGKKKRNGVAEVDMRILASKSFDKPVGHVGNVSEATRAGRVHADGKEDVWVSDLGRTMQAEKGVNRRRIEEKMNTSQREAISVIHPTHGLSVNPRFGDHQDKLGEALAGIVQKDDEHQWAKDKMAYDPALLNESTEGHVGDTGMREGSDVEENAMEDETLAKDVFKGVPARKSRGDRNRAARRRASDGNRLRKLALQKLLDDMSNIDTIAADAVVAADKLNGVTKLRELELNPPPKPTASMPVIGQIANERVQTEADAEPVTLSNELSLEMRSFKMPIANPVLRDRFLSFQRRGMIEPPRVLPKEAKQAKEAAYREAKRDRRIRKGRGSRSNLTFWRNGKSVIQ